MSGRAAADLSSVRIPPLLLLSQLLADDSGAPCRGLGQLRVLRLKTGDRRFQARDLSVVTSALLELLSA